MDQAKSVLLTVVYLLFIVSCGGSSGSAWSDEKKEQSSLLQGVAYDQHVELTWSGINESENSYQLEVSVNGGEWLKRITTDKKQIIDFVGDLGRNLDIKYRLSEVDQGQTKVLDEISLKTRDFSDDELLEMVQQYSFRYFWDFAEEKTGWARERTPNSDGDIITSGGTGFGIMSVIVGAERGWISRDAAVDRMLKLAKSLQEFEKFHGMWAHWYDADTQDVFHFSQYDDGGDIVESAFLAQGLLTARQYFNKNTIEEKQLRKAITALWENMEWDWYTRGGENILTWHWSKNYDWKMNHHIRGYNEALIVYILAASSPTHSISDRVYHEGWAGVSGYFGNYQTYYGMSLPLGFKDEMGGPLFFAHYSYLGLNPKGLKDRYADYWEQNRRHTLINRAYCIDNPYGWEGYGEDFWGLTAGDMVPKGYMAHSPGKRDYGTVTPTAALSSMPYAPEESMEVLKNLYYNHGKELFGPMGFYDGINLSVSDQPDEQVIKTYLAIDQGPIVAMMENYRSGLLWKYFMKDPDVKKGLDKLGFTIDGKEIK